MASVKDGVDWKHVLEDATLDAQKAVSRQSSTGNRSASVGTGASGDRTLVADKKAEDAIIKRLARIPGLRMICEEAGEIGLADSPLVAIVDPLDGSSNYERGVPFYCSSVGVVYGEEIGSLQHAIIRNLVTGDVYFAEKGRGASKNGTSIRTSKVKSLGSAVAGIDLSRASLEMVRSLAGLVSGVGRQVHLGANALELCMLAEGAIDVVVDLRGKARLVDFAGGCLVAREAGAIITTPTGGELSPPLAIGSRFDFVASANPGLHRLVLHALGLPGKP